MVTQTGQSDFGTVYSLSIDVGDSVGGVYSVFGSAAGTMTLPPAHQEAPVSGRGLQKRHPAAPEARPPPIRCCVPTAVALLLLALAAPDYDVCS